MGIFTSKTRGVRLVAVAGILSVMTACGGQQQEKKPAGDVVDTVGESQDVKPMETQKTGKDTAAAEQETGEQSEE